MKPFVKLAEPARYRAYRWDLCTETEVREHWSNYIILHSPRILACGIEAAIARGESRESVQARADACLAVLTARFREFQRSYHQHSCVTLLTFDRWRDGALREHGFPDCFIDRKERENALMLPLLPGVCAELDALDEPMRLRTAIKGVLAGNIFDLGAHASASRFLSGESPDFHEIRSTLPSRPWLLDDLDLLEKAWLTKVYKKAIFFIDNAGSDFILGALPLARWLAKRGTHVVLTANELPTLNDMTIHDLRAWWPRIVEAERSFASLPIEFISTGTGEPLIDLLEVSEDLNEAAKEADLVILEGMGRGVETNLDAAFTCDALNIAMLKDELVAKRLNGKVFDVVCRFRPGRT